MHGFKTAQDGRKLARKTLPTQIDFQNTFINAKNGRILKLSAERFEELRLFLKKGLSIGTSGKLTVCSLLLLCLLKPVHLAKTALLFGRPFKVKRQVF